MSTKLRSTKPPKRSSLRRFDIEPVVHSIILRVMEADEKESIDEESKSAGGDVK